jgi:hypothetical protein
MSNSKKKRHKNWHKYDKIFVGMGLAAQCRYPIHTYTREEIMEAYERAIKFFETWNIEDLELKPETVIWRI